MAYIDITPEARVDIALAIDLCPVEISGIGEVACEGDAYHITEALLFPQECYLDHTTFDQDAFGRYTHDLNKKRMATRGSSGMNTKRLWWHSHVWGRVRFSSVDTGYMEKFGRDTLPQFNPYLISIVGNKHGQLTTRLDVFKPLYSMEYLKLPLSDPSWTLQMLRDLYRERMPRMAKLIDEMVTIRRGQLLGMCIVDEFSSRRKI